MSDPMQQPDSPPLFKRPVFGTSHAAELAAAPRMGGWRQRILLRLEEQPSTLWEVAEYYEIQDHCISGRFTELCRDGYIEPTGEVRIKPSTSCECEVYRIRRAEASTPSPSTPSPSTLHDYPLTLRIGPDLYDRQELLKQEGYAGIPYARRAEKPGVGGARKHLRVELVECPSCGKPLALRADSADKTFACANGHQWRATVAAEPGGRSVLAMVMEKIS